MIFESEFTNRLKFKALKSYCWILVIHQYFAQAFLKQGTFGVILSLLSANQQNVRTSTCMLLIGDLTTKNCCVKITVSVWYHNPKWLKKIN